MARRKGDAVQAAWERTRARLFASIIAKRADPLVPNSGLNENAPRPHLASEPAPTRKGLAERSNRREPRHGLSIDSLECTAATGGCGYASEQRCLHERALTARRGTAHA